MTPASMEWAEPHLGESKLKILRPESCSVVLHIDHHFLVACIMDCPFCKQKRSSSQWRKKQWRDSNPFADGVKGCKVCVAGYYDTEDLHPEFVNAFDSLFQAAHMVGRYEDWVIEYMETLTAEKRKALTHGNYAGLPSQPGDPITWESKAGGVWDPGNGVYGWSFRQAFPSLAKTYNDEKMGDIFEAMLQLGHLDEQYQYMRNDVVVLVRLCAKVNDIATLCLEPEWDMPILRLVRELGVREVNKMMRSSDWLNIHPDAGSGPVAAADAMGNLESAHWYKHPRMDEIRLEISRLEQLIGQITQEPFSVEIWWKTLSDIPNMLSTIKDLLLERRRRWNAQGLFRRSQRLPILIRLLEEALTRIPDVARAVLTELGHDVEVKKLLSVEADPKSQLSNQHEAAPALPSPKEAPPINLTKRRTKLLAVLTSDLFELSVEHAAALQNTVEITAEDTRHRRSTDSTAVGQHLEALFNEVMMLLQDDAIPLDDYNWATTGVLRLTWEYVLATRDEAKLIDLTTQLLQRSDGVRSVRAESSASEEHASPEGYRVECLALREWLSLCESSSYAAALQPKTATEDQLISMLSLKLLGKQSDHSRAMQMPGLEFILAGAFTSASYAYVAYWSWLLRLEWASTLWQYAQKAHMCITKGNTNYGRAGVVHPVDYVVTQRSSDLHRSDLTLERFSADTKWSNVSQGSHRGWTGLKKDDLVFLFPWRNTTASPSVYASSSPPTEYVFASPILAKLQKNPCRSEGDIPELHLKLTLPGITVKCGLSEILHWQHVRVVPWGKSRITFERQLEAIRGMVIGVPAAILRTTSREGYDEDDEDEDQEMGVNDTAPSMAIDTARPDSGSSSLTSSS